MTLAVSAWPYDVNQKAVKETYREIPDENVARFVAEVGPPKVRARTSIDTDQVSFDTIMTTAQVAALKTFYKTTVKRVLPFARTRPGTTFATEVFTFNAPPQFQDWAFDAYRVALALRSQPGYAAGLSPYGAVDSFTKLMLHADGAESATAVTDSSAIGRVMTCHGTARLSQTRQRFGTAALYLDGTVGANVTTPSTADLTPAGDYTIEFWAFPTSFSALGCAISKGVAGGSGGYGPYAIQLDTSGNWRVYSSSNGSSWNIANGVLIGAGALTAWQHVAVVRSGNIYYPFVDGVLGSTFTIAGTPVSNSNALMIGELNGANPFNGSLDELRLSVGSARWTAAFTPATEAYTST